MRPASFSGAAATTPGPGTTTAGPASGLLERLAAWFGAAMRVGIGVTAGTAALVGAVAPVDIRLVAAAVAITAGWLALFAWVVWTRGLRSWLVVAELALTAVLCAGQRWLVVPEALAAGTSWVATTASVSIVVAHLAWRLPAAATAGLVVTGAYLAGGAGVVATDDRVVQAGTFLVQIAAAGGLMWLVRRAGRTADTALAGYHEARRGAEVAAARRAAEREHNQRLHDTVLATLTMVGTGSVPDSTEALRGQAGRDLAVVQGSRGAAADPRRAVRLDQRLRKVIAARRRDLDVRASLAACTVPAAVAEALAGACGQALTNVADHAGTARARVRLAVEDGRVRVEVADDGIGFDPSAVPVHRLGVREAILERMHTVGGQAGVVSSPDAGTLVWLRWQRA